MGENKIMKKYKGWFFFELDGQTLDEEVGFKQQPQPSEDTRIN